jgi:hypothetical protein
MRPVDAIERANPERSEEQGTIGIRGTEFWHHQIHKGDCCILVYRGSSTDRKRCSNGYTCPYTYISTAEVRIRGR